MLSQTSRKVVRKILNKEQAEGVGARVYRSIGTRELRNFSPFLLLDHAKTDPGAGFPDHPHRGMSTLTYALSGVTLHEDFLGNRGRLETGDLQFMIAGKGIVHSEIPMADKAGNPPEVLQLWIDLPSDQKLIDPSYQDMKASEIPTAHQNAGVTVRVICGESDGSASENVVASPVRPVGGCWFLDVEFDSKDAKVFQRIPKGWNALLFTIAGTVEVDNKRFEPHNTVTLSNEDSQDGILIESRSDKARLVVIAGEPLDQPIYQHGPFVMDSPQGIRQALLDYSQQQNGFENSHTWESKIKQLMVDPDADIDH